MFEGGCGLFDWRWERGGIGDVFDSEVQVSSM